MPLTARSRRRSRKKPSGRIRLIVSSLLLLLALAMLSHIYGDRHAGAAPVRQLVSEALSPEVAAAPPADLPAVADSPPAGAVHPGDRWAASGISYMIQGQEWDPVSLANVDEALSRLPDRILRSIGNRDLGGVTVLVNRSGRTLSGRQPYGQAANFFSTNDGRNELVLFPDQSPPTVLHELGHAYNLRRQPAGRYALVLLDPEMQSFMAAIGWSLVSSSAEVQAARDQTAVAFSYSGGFKWPRLSHDDPLEDFANSFALYFSDPASLKSQSPERFAWFEANVGR